jgi:hypothetical protein
MAMNLEIVELAAEHDAELSEFLDRLSAASPSVLGYHYPAYRDMLADAGVGTPVYLAARRQGELTAVLPAFMRRAPEGTVFSSLPFFGPNAGVLCGEGPQRDAAHAALLDALLDKARQSGAVSCSVYTPFLGDAFEAYERMQPDAVVEKFTQYAVIGGDGWNADLRYDLRRAGRLGVTVSADASPERLDALYEIYRQNCADRNIPLKPRACIERLTRPEALGKHAMLYFALHEDKVIGGLLNVCSPATVSYYVPCAADEARTLQPITVLIDRAFQDARAAGRRVWNWESSPSRDCGVYRFKEKWNSRESLYRIYVWCPRGTGPLAELGRERIAAAFPFFFVYPFDRL